MNILEAYNWLKNHSIETARLGSLAELAAWDQRTNIPPKGHENRAEQMGFLADLIHGRSVDKRIGDSLDILSGDISVLEDVAAVNIKMWHREYEREQKIPSELAKELALLSAKGESIWEQGAKTGDYSSFFPVLKELVELSRNKAEAIGYKSEPYDALIDEYEPGVTCADIEQLFSGIKDPLVSLIDNIKSSSVSVDPLIVNNLFDVKAQKNFCEKIVKTIGYDMDAGRIDEAVHPFTVSIGKGDVRITTRYNPNYFNSGIFGCIHEAGHAMYDQGLDIKHYGTPAGSFVSLGIHESQSRLWENMVGRSRGFWLFAYPIAQEMFSPLKNVQFNDFLRAVKAVSPGSIRVEADEVTYNLHVLLRFEIERELFRGNLEVTDIETVWNDKMQKYLGITPDNLKDGCMQDVHWSAGMFGYFPTYSLGNLYAAQLFAAARRELGDLDTQFAKGEFGSLLGWLRKNIHSKGQSLSARELVAQACGEQPDSTYFIDHCNEGYAALYEL